MFRENKGIEFNNEKGNKYENGRTVLYPSRSEGGLVEWTIIYNDGKEIKLSRATQEGVKIKGVTAEQLDQYNQVYRKGQVVAYPSRSEGRVLDWQIGKIEAGKVFLVRQEGEKNKGKEVPESGLNQYNQSGWRVNQQVGNYTILGFDGEGRVLLGRGQDKIKKVNIEDLINIEDLKA